MSTDLRGTAKLELAAEILASGGTVWIKAWGSSMLPAIWPGDLLAVQSAPAEDVNRGDIVLTMKGQRCYIHRVRDTSNSGDAKYWITRGDALRVDDPPVRAADLLGRVTQIQRDGRTLSPGSPGVAGRLLSYLAAHSDAFHNLLIRARQFCAQDLNGHSAFSGSMPE